MTVSRRALVSGLLLLPLAGRAWAEDVLENPFQLSGSARQGGALLGMVPHGAVMLMLGDLRIDYAVDGRFIIAFDRDAPLQPILLSAQMYDDRHVEQLLTVAPGNWRLEQVNAPLTGNATTNEEYQKRRALELEQIVAARHIFTQSEGWRQKFVLPVKARVSGVFGSQRIYQGTPGSYHSGLDLAGGAGTTYVAPADGVVTLAVTEPFTLEGNLLMLDHGMGLNSAFLHSQSLLVKQGDVVKQGQPLGRIGATGRASGPHLHWSMKWGESRIDPATFVDVNVKL